MPSRLPVTLRKIPGGYAIQLGPDKRATFYLYVEHDVRRVDPGHLLPDEAEALAKDVARALRHAFMVANKHGG